MKKNDFLNYISSLIDTKEVAYYDKNEQCFYFYHKQFLFKFKSEPSSSSLVIEEKNFGISTEESIALTYEETISLLEKIIPLIHNNNNFHSEKIEALGVEVFKNNIYLLIEFLKNYNPVEEIEKHSKNNKLEDYVIYFPLDNVNHICRIGQVANYAKKKEHLLTSLVTIPFFFLDNNTKKSGCIPYEIIVPSWKIKDYPILENFIDSKIYENNFSKTFENMVKKFQNGKELFKEILEHNMPELNNKIKPKKI